ncbi:MAG: M36 family metallopeptidase [Bryobacteraceae bacterium]
MPINFIPNDPKAGAAAPAIRVKSSRPNRPASRSGFTFTNTAPDGAFAPGTPQFLFWQCREAAIAALGAWETSAGNHTRWQGNRKKLPLRQDAGVDLNAFYNRQTFSFFHDTVGGQTFFSGASTDVVAHEVGHGLLDSVRPDFFSVNFLEVGAFHEAFGDCMALLTALSDSETQQKLLAAAPGLRKRNFVESTAEDLSFAIGLAIPGHNAAEPRHAFNKFQYQLPNTLPSNGGPGALINEEHSFGMLFTGCFWELLANLFAAAPSQTEVTLASSAALAGKILIAGARQALITPRFLQSVGRAMVLADQSLNGGANRTHISNAFQAHNILLGSNALVAPSASLAGGAPKGAAVSTATKKDLASRMGATRGAKLATTAAGAMVDVAHAREISLTGLDKSLKGVVCLGHDVARVGESGGRAAVMGAMPHRDETDLEVRAYVQTLLEHDRIEMEAPKSAVRSRAVAAKAKPKSHAIKAVRGKKMLVRVCYQCG